jgi:hypothetical protein
MPETPTKARTARVTLTKAQLATPVGAELAAKLTAIADDGRVTDEEVADLAGWLDAHRDVPMAAIAFLLETLAKREAEPELTRERLVQYALQRVLPKESRERAATAYNARIAREIPADHYRFPVAGVKHEGRVAIVDRYLSEGDEVFLERDPDNQFSENAVKVLLANGLQIGFVPEHERGEEMALQIFCELSDGLLYRAECVQIGRATGSPNPIVAVELYRPDAVVEGLRREGERPAARAASAESQSPTGTDPTPAAAPAPTEIAEKDGTSGIPVGFWVAVVFLLGAFAVAFLRAR